MRFVEMLISNNWSPSIQIVLNNHFCSYIFFVLLFWVAVAGSAPSAGLRGQRVNFSCHRRRQANRDGRPSIWDTVATEHRVLTAVPAVGPGEEPLGMIFTFNFTRRNRGRGAARVIPLVPLYFRRHVSLWWLQTNTELTETPSWTHRVSSYTKRGRTHELRGILKCDFPLSQNTKRWDVQPRSSEERPGEAAADRWENLNPPRPFG